MNKSEYKILISDDSILARKQLADILKSLGYTSIITAANGQEAIDCYKSKSPDLVFLDIVMPIKDGIEATREIIEFDKNADIVMASSVGTQKNLNEAIQCGAGDFVQKPITKEAISEILNKRESKEN